MNNKPFFSILIPTYNQAQYLGEALESAIAQTYKKWEAIIINDGSTDATDEVIEIYCNKDSRFKAIHKKNGGVGSALNKGLEKAQGEWTCWLSSDDLFEPNKLEIHQNWINNYPDTYFFFSHFKYLNDETGEITNPELWLEIPEVKWQILKLLNCPYLHGNSICINRKVWQATGKFDESLRYGQDYDMWLRLLASNVAVYIPERTCITRFHPSQDSKKFPEAGFYDSAKAGINFLNIHKFDEIVPLVNLSDPIDAIAAIDKALNVATNFDSVLYSLGSHPALIWRIMEWVWKQKDTHISAKAKQLIATKSSQASWKYFDLPFGFLWKAIALAFKVDHPKFIYNEVLPVAIAEANYWWQKSNNYEISEALFKYLEKYEHWSLDSSFAPKQGEVKEVTFVFQKGASVDDLFKYGALRATLEIAKHLQKSGRKVLLTGLSSQSMGFTERILFVGTDDETKLLKSLKSLQIIDTVVSISRADILLRLPAIRFLVYHHGPHQVISGGEKSQKINLANIPVACVSQSSKNFQVNCGIDPKLVHIIPNGCDFSIFNVNDAGRHPHSLVFAGNTVSYKGIDIALEAFIKIKKYFPDAIFNVCGSGKFYNDSNTDNHQSLLDQWLNIDGSPNWQIIEKEILGVKYRGVVSQIEVSKLFRQSSLLVAPSRIAETFGLVSIEAQACGCLPVLPCYGGFPETLKDNETGYLYEPNTSEVLADKIIDLWSNSFPLESQRNYAQNWVREKFSWKESGEIFLALLESPQSKSKISLSTKIIYSIRQPIYFVNRIIVMIKEGIFYKKLKGKLSKSFLK